MTGSSQHLNLTDGHIVKVDYKFQIQVVLQPLKSYKIRHCICWLKKEKKSQKQVGRLKTTLKSVQPFIFNYNFPDVT